MTLIDFAEVRSLNVALFRRPAQQRKVRQHLGDGPRPKRCTRQCLCPPPMLCGTLTDLGHGLLVDKRTGFGQNEEHSQKLLSFFRPKP